MTFLILCIMTTPAYLFTEEFLVDSFINNTFFIERTKML